MLLKILTNTFRELDNAKSDKNKKLEIFNNASHLINELYQDGIITLTGRDKALDNIWTFTRA